MINGIFYARFLAEEKGKASRKAIRLIVNISFFHICELWGMCSLVSAFSGSLSCEQALDPSHIPQRAQNVPLVVYTAYKSSPWSPPAILLFNPFRFSLTPPLQEPVS
jgi:hypothetical protein